MNLATTLLAPGTVRVERLLPGPVERVWAYIVDAEKRATWFCGGEFELREGGRVRLQFDNDSLSSDKSPPEKYRSVGKSAFEGVMTRYEPMRLLAHTWPWDSGDTEVTYELTPRGREVLLAITHRRLDGSPLPVNVMSGWDVHTGILEDVLSGVEPRPFWKTHAALEKAYEAAV
jgi:uncharacterized protein YndB with AHSA1/START domain